MFFLTCSFSSNAVCLKLCRGDREPWDRLCQLVLSTALAEPHHQTKIDITVDVNGKNLNITVTDHLSIRPWCPSNIFMFYPFYGDFEMLKCDTAQVV